MRPQDGRGQRGQRGQRGPALATTALVLLLLVVVSRASTAVAVAGAAGVVGGALAVAGLMRGDSFEARLTAAVVAGGSGLLAVVGMVLGAPGSPTGGGSAIGLLVTLASVAVLVLLQVATPGRPQRRPTTRPYAP